MLRWRSFIADALAFLEGTWATCAALLGWTEHELFGADSTNLAIRADRMGLMWFVQGGRITSLDSGGAVIERNTTSKFHSRRRIDPKLLNLPWSWNA
jgi:hypothetical protein